MSRKVFISFLGTTKYKPCRYKFENQDHEDQEVETFVQVSLLRKLHNEFTGSDSILIFLTRNAKSLNWEDDGHTDFKTKTPIKSEGLKSILEKLSSVGLLKARIEPVFDTPEGFSSDEIWAIFKMMNDRLCEEDEVYLDITHAFRYLPMLALSLMNYERALKGVTVKAIYYGAFEALGSGYDVDQRIPDPTNRVAPIINLLSLEKLQQWSLAIYDLDKKGDAFLLRELAKSEMTPILIETKGRDQMASTIRELTNRVHELTEIILTNRGLHIEEQKGLKESQEALAHLEESGCLIKPMEPLLQQLKRKLSELGCVRYPPWLNSARWCLHHNLVQQGITQLQEGIVSHVLRKLPELDVRKVRDRQQVSESLQLVGRNDQLESDNKATVASTLMESLRQVDNMKQLASIFLSINNNYRNDINHCGYRPDPRAPSEFKSKLAQNITKIEALFNEASSEVPSVRTKKMINLSNHPVSTWSYEQLNEALVYGQVEDLTFPGISPECDKHVINEMADDYFRRIVRGCSEFEVTVHLMGELTFCFALLRKLEGAGIKVIASSTARTVVDEQNGVKKSTFKFVRFREY